MEVIEVLSNGKTTSIAVENPNAVQIVNAQSQSVVVTQSPETETAVVTIPQGLPGAQNLYVGYTPPSNPQEGWVWIDLNG